MSEGVTWEDLTAWGGESGNGDDGDGDGDDCGKDEHPSPNT